MPFIGQEPITGAYHVLDDITTSSTNTYNLLLNGGAFSPASANHLLVSLNGVIQKPGSSFTISGSQITFVPSSGTLSNSDNIDFIMALGDVLNIGTPTDGSVSSAKLSSVLDLSGTGRTGHGGLKSIQVFTSSGTYTRPSGITRLKVICTGGGGGGGECKATFNYNGGGAAGGTAIDFINISSTPTVAVTIGEAGTGASAGNGSAGGNGGTSSFGPFCSATGGEGGKPEGNSSRAAPGIGSGGVINIEGGQGGSQGGGNLADQATGGLGGASFWGGGGTNGSGNIDTSAGLSGQGGRAFGSGGGAGRHHNNGTFGEGGAGKAGVVFVEEYA